MFPYSFLAFLFKCRALACYVKVFPGFVLRLLSPFPLLGTRDARTGLRTNPDEALHWQSC
jgi:hypothetical protein